MGKADRPHGERIGREGNDEIGCNHLNLPGLVVLDDHHHSPPLGPIRCRDLGKGSVSRAGAERQGGCCCSRQRLDRWP